MPRRDRGPNKGLVLLEVMIALAILAVAGVSALTLAVNSLAAIERAQRANQASERASHFMDAVSLWTRSDLDRHLGDRSEGAWRLSIGRPVPTVYVVSLRDTATNRDLFTTSLFRPEASYARP